MRLPIARATIYNNPDLLEQIRAEGHTPIPTTTSEATGTAAFLQQQLHASKQAILALEAENAQLKHELAAAEQEIQQLRNQKNLTG